MVRAKKDDRNFPQLSRATLFKESSAALVGLLLAGAGLVWAQDYPHAYPRDGAEHLFENDRVSIWEVIWPDGVPQPYHRHRYDMTGVFLRWGPLRVTRLDGTFTDSEVPFELPNVFLLPKGVTHKEEGIGTPLRHAIMIDLKETADAPVDSRTDIPPAFPQDGAEEALDHARVRVWDVSWPAGHTVPLHVHPTDTVLVFLEGGTINTTQEDGTEDTTTYSEKEIAFLPAGTAHTTRVVNGSPRVMFYELKD